MLILKHIRRFPELIPLVGLVTATSLAGTSYCIYSVYQKPDVHLMKYTNVPPHENVDPTKSQKLHTLEKGGYRVNPELEALRKEIGVYKLK